MKNTGKPGIIITAFFLHVALFITAQPCKQVIGYYPDWKYYTRNDLLKPSLIDYTKYSIINFAFVEPNANGTISMSDSYADPLILLGPAIYYPVTGNNDSLSLPFLCHQHNVKLLISVGGWSYSANFSGISASLALRDTFTHYCANLVRTYNLDGIDIDWEYPVSGGEQSGVPADKHNYTVLMQQLRDTLNALGTHNKRTYLLTATFPSAPANQANYEWSSLIPVIDMFNLMTYDFFGSWSPVSNFNAPLYASEQGDSTFNDTSSFQRLVRNCGVPANKINMGLPFYGRSFASCTGLFQTFNGVDNTTFSADAGIPEYYNILLNMSSFSYHWDNHAKVPYLDGVGGLNTFVSYDDKKSVGLKVSYALSQGAAGVEIWEISGDYIETTPGSGVISGTPLVDTINQIMCAYVPTSVINTPNPQQTVLVYPNPSNGVFNIDFHGTQNFVSKRIEVFNVLGEKVYSALLPQIPKGALNTIDLSNQAKGVYLYRILTENGEYIASGKLVIQ